MTSEAASTRPPRHPGSEVDDPEQAFLAAELERAIDRRQILVFYQPVVDLVTGRTVSVEALVRWRRPGHGVIGPDGFLALAQTCGLVGAVTRLVVEQVLGDARTWRAAGHPLRCSVNVAAVALTDPATADALVTSLSQSVEVVTLEVVGSVLEDAAAVAVLERLRLLGVECVVDDYGRGTIRLGALRRLPVSGLKLDRHLVGDVGRDRQDLDLVAAMVTVGRALGLPVAASGIEDGATAAVLREVGVTHGQGHHVAMPMDPVSLLGWLATPPTGLFPTGPGEGADGRDGWIALPVLDTDPLTGLGTRRALGTLAGMTSSGVLAIVDLHDVHDSLGSTEGDRVLVAFSRVLRHHVRGSDGLFRLRGAEFLVVLEGRDPDDAIGTLRSLRERWSVASPDGVSFSVGVAAFEGGDVATAIVRADEALSRARSNTDDGLALWSR